MIDTTTPTGADGLAGLVAKWRAVAPTLSREQGMGWRNCADELEAALSSVADGETAEMAMQAALRNLLVCPACGLEDHPDKFGQFCPACGADLDEYDGEEDAQ